jgi:uncharacterized protein
LHNTYQPRTYRGHVIADNLACFQVIVEETDVLILSDSDFSKQARCIIKELRLILKNYINKNPKFARSLTPVSDDRKCPDIIRDMIHASRKCMVGPMASVAGAMSEAVGKELLKYSSQVIVENGGDIFMSSNQKRIVGVYTGEDSKFNNKLAIQINPKDMPCGICTSSATIGHSLSFGNADAAVVISDSCSLADACATCLCNMVKTKDDIAKAINFGKSIKGINGILVVMKDRLGAWGNISLV